MASLTFVFWLQLLLILLQFKTTLATTFITSGGVVQDTDPETTSTVTAAPVQVDMATWSRPSWLPFTGWCGVPGSPCGKVEADAEERDATPVVTALPTEVDVATWSRPTWLPFTGWCGVPGSACGKVEVADENAIESRDMTPTVTAAPTKEDIATWSRPTWLPFTGWCGVPGSPCGKVEMVDNGGNENLDVVCLLALRSTAIHSLP